MQPKDEDEFVDMLYTMSKYDDGPTAIRYPRGVIKGTPVKATPALIEIGKAEVVADGTDVALIGLGTMFEMAERAKTRFTRAFACHHQMSRCISASVRHAEATMDQMTVTQLIFRETCG